MARTEARIFVDIWDDPDFLALSTGGQRLYLFLISQPDLAHDGVMPLRERRWARTAPDLKLRQLLAHLDELVRARFVVVDEDTEELLVRSFIRRDGVCRQPNLIRAARAHLPLVRSATIRATLVDELRRLVDDATLDKTHDLLVLTLADLTQPSANGSPNPTPNPNRNPSANPSGNPSANGRANPTTGALGERGVVTAVTTDAPNPFPPAASQQPPELRSTPAPAAAQRLLLEALAEQGITSAEADAIAEQVRRERQPRNLPGLLRAIAAAGELPAMLDAVRVDATRTASTVAIAEARRGPPCEHGEPGGANPHPDTGRPLCPLCRTAPEGGQP